MATGRPALEQRPLLVAPGARCAPAEAPDGEPIAAYLRALPLAGAVTFPTSDDWAIDLASLPRDIDDAFRATTAPADVLLTLIDKGAFATAAERSGVPVPRTFALAGPDDLDALSDEELPGYLSSRATQSVSAPATAARACTFKTASAPVPTWSG